MSKRISQEAIRRMIDSRGGSGGGSGSIDPSALAGLASMAWVEEGYISKVFFNGLFIIHKKETTVVKDGDTVISTTVDTSGTFAPNEIPGTTSETDSETGYVTTVTTEISNIEAKKGVWTNYFLSALGLNSGGGLSLNEPLLSINNAGLSAPTAAQNGMTVVYNSTTEKWEYGTAGGGGGGGSVTSIGMTVPTGFSVSPETITSSGTFAITFANGYSLPLTTDVNKGVTAYGWGDHRLAGYATQSWVGQQGYLTSSAISDMATKTWVGQQGFLTSSAISDMATKTWVGQQGFLTSASGTFWGKSWSNGGTVNGTIYAGSGGGSIEQFTSIELNSAGTLSNYGGFIDFHYNAQGTTFDPTVDYTSRIIEDASGVINLNNALYAKLSGNVSIGTSTISNTYKLNVNGYTKTTRLYLTDSVYLMYDSANSGVKLVGAGFYTDSYVSALGLNSGSGGVTLNEPLNAINNAGLGTPTQSGVAIMWNGSAWTYQVPGGGSGGGGTVTSVGLTMPTGFSVAGQPVTGSGTIIITFANGYSLPLTTDVNKGVTAYGWGDHRLAGYATQSWVGQQGYLTSSAISDMATKTWVGQQGYLTSSAISDMATKTWVGQQGYLTSSAISDMATKTWVGQQGFLTQNAGDGRYASLTSANNLVYNNNEITVIPTGFVGQGGKLWINYSCGTDSSNANFTAYHMGNGTRGTTNGGYADVTANGFVKNGSSDSYVLLGGGGHKMESELSVGTASKLSTTQTYTAWGQTYWSGGVPASISGNMTDVGSITANGNITTTKANTTDAKVVATNNNGGISLLASANRGIYDVTNSSWLIGTDGTNTFLSDGNVGIGTTAPTTKLDVNGTINCTSIRIGGYTITAENGGLHINSAGLYADTYISALGLSSGGGGGATELTDLVDVAVSSPTNGQVLMYNSSTSKWYNGTVQSGGSGTVTNVATGTGLTGGPITSTGTISINSTYQTYISHGESAYNNLINYLPLDGSSAMTGALKVAQGKGIEDATYGGILCTRPTNWTGVSSSQWGVGEIFAQGVLRSNNSNLVHYKSNTAFDILDSSNSYVSSGKGYINGTEITTISGNSSTASRLSGSGSYSAWGQTYWSSGVPSTISGDMTSVGNITASGNIKVVKSSTADIEISTQNNNGKVGLLASSNKGFYDFSNSKWIVANDSTGTYTLIGDGNNVGIGLHFYSSTTPQYKLHVVGSIFGNSLYTNNNLSSVAGGTISGFHGIDINDLGSGTSGNGGYIDFHYDGTSNDYSSRFIETDYGLMKLMSKNSSGTNQRAAFVVGEGYTSSYIQIGDIRMVYDSNHNLRVVKADGTPASLYATGGISALGMSAGTSSIDSMTFGYLKVNNQLTFGNNYASIYMDDFFYINSSSTISINGVECDGNGNIYTNGNARANRFYLDSNRYLYVSSGTLYYYNGSTSKAVAFTN